MLHGEYTSLAKFTVFENPVSGSILSVCCEGGVFQMWLAVM